MSQNDLRAQCAYTNIGDRNLTFLQLVLMRYSDRSTYLFTCETRSPVLVE